MLKSLGGSGGAGAVESVNGETGVVVLDATDVGAAGTTANTFTGAQTIAAAEPRVIFNETDQGTDLKVWDLDLASGVFTLRTRTDVDGTGKNILAATRGATTALSNIAFGNATDNPTGTWLGTGTFTFGGGISAGGGTLSGGIATMGRFVPSSSSVPTNGINLPAGNTLGLSTNSVVRVRVESTGQVALQTVGAGLSIAEGSNAKMGLSTLVGGTVTVSTTAVTTNSRIFMNQRTAGGTLGVLSYTIVNGTSFTITSTSAIDTSTVNWMIVEPS